MFWIFLIGTLTAFLPLPPAWHELSAGRCAMAEGARRDDERCAAWLAWRWYEGPDRPSSPAAALADECVAARLQRGGIDRFTLVVITQAGG